MSEPRTFGIQGSVTVTEEELAARAEAEAATAVAETPVEGLEDEMCMVTAMQPAKGSETLRVPVGTAVSTILDELGWEYGSKYTFKLTTDGKPGYVLNFRDPSQQLLEAGSHFLVVQPKIRGG